METDIDNSDRISPNKQRINCNEPLLSNEVGESSTSTNNTIQSYEEEKRRKLREWQAWQVIKASEDNSLNEMIILVNPINNSWNETLTEFIMENQAVSMAIQNHGLVRPNFSLPQELDENYSVNCHALDRYVNFLRNTEIDNTQIPNKNAFYDDSEQNHIKDKTYDNDQQDFLLEQAVVEAIKKKGLSALTADYG